MSYFSQNELVDMIFVLGECERNCLLASRVYRARYPDRERHPREDAFENLLHRFINTGSVQYTKNEKSKNVLNDEREFEVIASVIENPHASTRELNKSLEISRTSVRRILKKNRFHPFHIQLHQELEDIDLQMRTNFCRLMQQKINDDANFSSRILFTDELTFHRNGYINTHNFHYYSDENPHNFQVHHSQHRWSINIWAGIMGTRVIGPYFIDGTLNARKYLNFLQHDLFDLMEEVPLAHIRDMIFQQDGAPPHHAREVTHWLNATFPQAWIGRGGPIQWPRRSPDLTPLDFFLWAYIKNIVYQEPTTTAEDMKLRIRRAFSTITPAMLTKVTTSFHKRIEMCLNNQGGHFEHLL